MILRDKKLAQCEPNRVENPLNRFKPDTPAARKEIKDLLSHLDNTNIVLSDVEEEEEEESPPLPTTAMYRDHADRQDSHRAGSVYVPRI